MPSPKRQLGDLGEKLTIDYLKKQGYHILANNYQKPWGEIDIIARHKKNIVFVEVKTRTASSKLYAYPEDNVQFPKKQRLIRTARTYLLEKNYSPETPWQIDVIAVELNLQTKKANLKHIKNTIWQ